MQAKNAKNWVMITAILLIIANVTGNGLFIRVALILCGAAIICSVIKDVKAIIAQRKG